MISFKHIKYAVEGSLQGRVTQQLEAFCLLQSSAGALGVFVLLISYSASSNAEHWTCC